MQLPYIYPGTNPIYLAGCLAFVQERIPNIVLLSASNSGFIFRDQFEKYALVQIKHDGDDYSITKSNVFKFHTGPADHRTDLFIEDLLVVAMDRLKTHQAGSQPCESNAEALVHLERALSALDKRTAESISK